MTERKNKDLSEGRTINKSESHISLYTTESDLKSLSQPTL